MRKSAHERNGLILSDAIVTHSDTASEPLGFVPTAAFNRLVTTSYPVVILAAPAGYGKSTLLTAIARALELEGKSCGWRGLEVQHGEQLPSAADVIFIDDAHLAPTERLVQIVRSACASDSGQRLIIATRVMPEADWLSLEAAGNMDILRPEELVLGRAETEAVLRQYSDGEPTPGQVDQINAIIQGWPIAAQWFGMLARKRGGWGRFSITASHSRDDLGRYLNEMIYAELDEHLRSFLFDIADLEVFSAAMIEAVLGSDGVSMLHRLRRENMLLQPAGLDGGVLKFHGLFQAFLERKKREVGEPLNAPLLEKASQWSEAEGQYSEAVEYAIKAGQLERAHELLAAHSAHIVNVRGELPGMLRWSDSLRGAGIALDLSLALWRVWALLLAGDLARAEAELERAGTCLSVSAPVALHLHAARLELSLAARRQAPEVVIEKANLWLEQWGSIDPFHTAAACVLRAFAHHALGQTAAAQRDIVKARQAALECEGLYARMWVAKSEAYVSLQTGRVTQAKDSILTAIDLATGEGTVSISTLGTLHLLAARIFVELREFNRAREHLVAGHLHLADTGLIEIRIASIEATALLIEEDDGVDSALREVQSNASAGLRAAVENDLLAIRLMLRHGRISDARETFNAVFERKTGQWQHLAYSSEISSSLIPSIDLVSCALLFADSKWAAAATELGRLLPLCERRGIVPEYLAALFLSAATAHAEGRTSEARRYFGRALRLAAEKSSHQSVVNSCWPLKSMLADCADLDEGLRSDAVELLKLIRHCLNVHTGEGQEQTLIDPLTPRETEVLSMLDSGLNSDAVAGRLDMGLSTVKWHIRNIYGKLGVRNRSGALARARRLGLI